MSLINVTCQYGKVFTGALTRREIAVSDRDDDGNKRRPHA
jgi:hypothetical protein